MALMGSISIKHRSTLDDLWDNYSIRPSHAYTYWERSTAGNDTYAPSLWTAFFQRQLIDGGAGNDKLTGGFQADTLVGGLGNDTLNGGWGNDLLIGGQGNDKYEFTQGGGRDTIINRYNSAGNALDLGYDTLSFKGLGFPVGIFSPLWPSLTSANANWSRTSRTDSNGDTKNNDLTISFKNSKDSVTIQDFFEQTTDTEKWAIDKVEFADKKSFTTDDIYQRFAALVQKADAKGGYMSGMLNYANNMMGSAKDDYFNGGSQNDTMQGGAGNDTLDGNDGNDSLSGGAGDDDLFGVNGNDVLSGGSGNDNLYGWGGDDTYIHNLGDGQDAIGDTDGNDVIKIMGHSGNVSFEELNSAWNGVSHSLVISFSDSADTITIDGFFEFKFNEEFTDIEYDPSCKSYQVERIEVYNPQTGQLSNSWTSAEIVQMFYPNPVL